ncbi:MAG: TonB-dependent receptor [Bryobacteraceae bacterium]
MKSPWVGLLFALPTLSWAQSYTASVRGTVSDTTQAAVPSATITLTDVDRNVPHAARTDSAGRYVLPALPPGMYALTVESPGFRKHTQPAFQLAVQQQATINVELTVGELATSVEVTGAAPMLNTTAATLGQVVENKFILSAPLAARNPLVLVTLAAGIIPAENSAGGSSGVNFVANGVRANSSDVMLDGMNLSGIDQNGGITEMKYTPSVDLIEEFKVQTNFYAAEFGNSGGALINMVSKSGTNELHGVVYEFHRNAALNANDFFSNRAGRTIPDFKRNVFGGTAGGPVFFPKIYNGKNRTFFFVLYEGDRQTNPSSTLSTVPTAQQIAGDFSDTRRSNGQLFTIYNPFDTYTAANGQTLRRPFPGNAIPASLHSRVAKNLLAFYPAPTSEGAPFTRVNNFFAQGIRKADGERIDGKIDHNLGEKMRISSRYSVNWTSANAPNLIGNIADRASVSSGRRQNFVFDITRTHSPTTVVTARFGILRRATFSDPISAGFDQTSLGFPAYMLENGRRAFPDITPANYLAIGGSSFGQTHAWETSGNLVGGVTKIAGGHTIKMGSEVRNIQENFYQHGYQAGTFSFSRNVTGENPLVANANQGDAIASMLLGWGSGGQYGFEWPTAMYGQFFGVYFMDDWRVTRNLTLNLGLRYDFETPRRERFDRLNWYDFDAPSPLRGKVPEFPNLKGQMRFVDDEIRSAFDGDWNNMQPRIGIAYALGNKMSVRAGYGIFYTASRHSTSGELGSAFRVRPGIEWSRDGSLTRFASLENPYPVGFTPLPERGDPLAYLGLGFNAYVREQLNPQYQQWNLSIQREAPGNGVVEINYAGSKGTHLYFGSSGDVLDNRNKLDPVYWDIGRTELNRQVPNPFFGIVTSPQSLLSRPTVQSHFLLRDYPHHAGAVGRPATPNIANSIYHSVQFKYEKRFSQGLAVIAHYTISKMISDSDVNNSEVNYVGGVSGLQNWKNLRHERSVSVSDIPQRAVISFNYQLPFGRGRTFGRQMNRIADALTGGWEVSGILTFSSGYPIIPGLASGVLWDAAQRPNYIGDPRTLGSPAERIDGYFNEAAFSRPEPDTYGTAARTLPNYRTFGIRNGDFTLMKNFVFAERKSLQLRLESFNLTNTPSFGRPDSSFGSNSFGVIGGYASGRGPRELQVAFKFYY